MIEVHRIDDDAEVLVAGNSVDIIDVGSDYVLAECELADLEDEAAPSWPDGLTLQMHCEDGFGTYLFYELELSAAPDGVALSFRCHTPNKYWEGRFGLATMLTAIGDQVTHADEWTVDQIELDDDWKGITLTTAVPTGEALVTAIVAAAADLLRIIAAAEVALAGLVWKEQYATDEGAFCREVLHPLLRRMGFLFVRYTHGRREYGKDFTFSELTPFGQHRHYGLQAKAGDVGGGVNAAIDELLGQIEDAFSMPYYELGSRDPRYISTFVIAISGRFTENAREKIAEKSPKGLVGSILFLDRDAILELADRFWRSG